MRGHPANATPSPNLWGLTRGQEKELEATRDLYHKNFEVFCKSELWIVDRDSPTGVGVKPFELNAAQKKLLRTIDLIKLYNIRRSTQLNKENPEVNISEYPIQLVILKPRKVGISTFLQARALWRCEFEQNLNCLIMAHENGSARNIASISKRFIEKWEPHSVDYRKHIDRCTDKNIYWGKDQYTGKEWGSQIHVVSAGKATKGTTRGFTFHYVHISEEAHYQSESEVSAALAATVPFKETYEESTANGIGGMFHDNYTNSADIESVIQGRIPENWNGKFRFFFGWYEDPEYKLPVTDTERRAIESSLTPREKELIELFQVTTEQLAWRRYKIGSECTAQTEMDPEDYFNQEYPSEPHDAFVTSGTAAFSLRPLTDMHTAGKKLGIWHWQGHLTVVDTDDLCHRMATGHEPTCIQYLGPKPGAQYIIGVDTASGLAHGDQSVISVWWRKGLEWMEEVARVINKAQADDLARMAVFLAREYNDAFIIPEANPPGNATCLYIQRMGYTNCYMRENPERIGGDGIGDTFTLGFYTNLRTKPLLVTAGQDAVRNSRILNLNRTAIRQWEIYRNNAGKYCAPEGEKDDCVMADLLCVWAHFTGAAPLVRKWHTENGEVEDEKSRAVSAENEKLWAQLRKIKKAIAKNNGRKRARNIEDLLGRFM